MDFGDLTPLLERAGKVVLTGHVDPDGDALGSALALARFLRGRGKRADVLIDGSLPDLYAWISREGEILPFEDRHADLVREADVLVAIDFGAWDRIGRVGEVAAGGGPVTVGIDHHPSQGPRPAIDVVDTTAAACGILVLELVREMGGTVDADLAVPLFTALATDTGFFRFSNADPRAFRAAADLVAAGAQPHEIFTKVYERSSERRLRVLGESLLHLGTDCGGRLAWMVVPRDLRDRFGIDEEETEGFVDTIRTLADVEIAVLFKEIDAGKVKASLRSRRTADVSAVARSLGGGGHARAAGATLDGPLDAAVERVLAACRPRLDGG